MKTTIYSSLILAGFMALSVACDNGDEGPSLVGTYTLTQENTTGCIDPGDNGNKTKTCTAIDCETLTINKNKSFAISEISNGITKSITGTYVISGNFIFFTSIANGTDRAVFDLSKSQLILTFEQESDGCMDVDTYARE